MHLKLCFVFLLISCGEGTSEDEYLDQQHFKTRPQSVKLIEGQTTELQCQIGNKGGQVQWSKDGFVLGYEADIPGFPRYQMIVDEPRGIYNLRLNKVTLEDEAEYQCQVGPVPEHQAIWSAAYLTVLVPPKQIELRHKGNDSGVVEATEGDQLLISCWVRDTKPPVTIRWFRNNHPLDKDKVHKRVDTNGDRELSSVFTKVEIYPRLDDAKAVYTCEAQHPALKAPLRASVTLSVLYPPNAPEIQGYPETELMSGDSLTLVCMSRGGNPPARLEWFKNDTPVRSRYRQNDHETMATYSIMVSEQNDGLSLRCDASNPVIPVPLSASLTLTVKPFNLAILQSRQKKRKMDATN